jgi:hypothetical protein
VKSNIQYYDLLEEIRRLRNRVSILERNRTGYSISGVVHIGEAEAPPTLGPSVGTGGFLYVENGTLKWMGTTNTPRQIALP